MCVHSCVVYESYGWWINYFIFDKFLSQMHIDLDNRRNLRGVCDADKIDKSLDVWISRVFALSYIPCNIHTH